MKTRSFKHSKKVDYDAVLNLARFGSIQLGLSEFKRLELDKVRNHEDIMALHGRLYKDLFLSQSDKEALEAARLSAEKYEAAFKDTRGFYSGINSATMSLLAGFDESMIQSRAKRIIAMLPSTVNLDSESKYFVEATRAEAQLLLGNTASALRSLRIAFEHDPLNYTAHASTIKQFRMIAEHRHEEYDWLAEFRPPITVQFAGHMFGIKEELGDETNIPCLSKNDVTQLRTEISETIQLNDIGFAFGALAAGSDILIAEAILEEGGELNITLPLPKEAFIELSVKPYGQNWVEKFEFCYSNARSVKVCTESSIQTDISPEKRASLASMGAAIRQAQCLAVNCAQLLIWDGRVGDTGTAQDAKIWKETERPCFVIRYNGPRPPEKNSTKLAGRKTSFTLASSANTDTLNFSSLLSALSTALNRRLEFDPEIKQVLDEVSDEKAALDDPLIEHALPGSILVSESVANIISVYHFKDYIADFIGVQRTGNHIYALREKGSIAI